MVYTRDRVAFAMSFLSVIILLILYQLFLGQSQLEAIKENIGNQELTLAMTKMINYWLIAGLTTIISLTSTLGAYNVMVQDREKKIDEDIGIGNLAYWKISLSYIIAAVFLGSVITIVCCFLGILFFNGINALNDFSMITGLKVILMIIFSCILSSSIVLPFLTFIKTGTAFTMLSTIIGTVIGFLAGVYISIGSVGRLLAQIMTWFPLTQINAMLKNVLMEKSMNIVFKNASANTLEKYKKTYGITLYNYAEKRLSQNQLLVYPLLITISLTIVYLAIKKGKNVVSFVKEKDV